MNQHARAVGADVADGGRIAVTGLGLVTALGADAEGTFHGLCRGERGFSPATLFDTTGYRSELVAEVRNFRVQDVSPRGDTADWSRSDALALQAAREALRGAGFPDGAAGCALAVGASTGGMYEVERVLAAPDVSAGALACQRPLAAYPVSNSARQVGRVIGASERHVTVCSACSSSAAAIALGAAWITSGVSDRVLAGGTDGLCLLTFAGFNSLGATDPAGCRPFDVRRAGLTLGEGAAFLMLEAERTAISRGAPILAWLSGWALAAEAYHITQPEPTGSTAAHLLTLAMRRAGLRPEDIDYLNAHGTGTPHNDAMETNAIHRAFGESAGRLLVSSSKGQIGHTLAAAGAVEAAITVLALSRGIVPPTGGLEQPDPALALEHVRGTGARVPIRAAVTSSFGFGGAGAVLAFERAGAPPREAPRRVPGELVVTGAACWGELGLRVGSSCADYASGTPRQGALAAGDALVQLDPERSRRFDLSSALVTAGAEAAVRDAGLPGQGLGLVVGSSFGSAKRTVEFLQRLFTRGPRFVSPAEFPHLVPSAPAGNASVYSGYSGPVLTVSDLHGTSEAAIHAALTVLQDGLAEAMAAGAAVEHDDVVERVLAPACTGETVARGQGAAFIALETESHARARGARILARVRRHGALADVKREVGVPRGRAVLVCTQRCPPLDALEGSAWVDAECVNLETVAGAYEARGAIAVAVAAALLARGSHDEALVVTGAPRALQFIELGRA